MVVRVLVIGESLIDVVDGVEHPGGSPMNVAYGLARLGEKVRLLTSLGHDDRGEAIDRHVTAAGVEIVPASFGSERTATATVRVDAAGVASYDFDIRWQLPEVRPTDGGNRLADELAMADIVHTGSIAAFLAPGADVVREMLQEARKRRALVSFDPNIRAALVGPHAGAASRFEELARLADLVKLSDEDAAWLYPDASVDRVLDMVLALGPALAVVTRGADGAVLATESVRVTVPGVEAEVIDTIGAGDSFMSALVSGVARMLDERDASSRDGRPAGGPGGPGGPGEPRGDGRVGGASGFDGPARDGAAGVREGTVRKEAAGVLDGAVRKEAGGTLDRAAQDGAARVLDGPARDGADVLAGAVRDPGRVRSLGEFAVRCAAITVSRVGANPPTRAEADLVAPPKAPPRA
jgi:fructokinase